MTFLELFTFWDSNLKKPTVQLYIQNVLNFRNSRKGNVSFVWSLAEKIIISPLMIRHRSKAIFENRTCCFLNKVTLILSAVPSS